MFLALSLTLRAKRAHLCARGGEDVAIKDVSSPLIVHLLHIESRLEVDSARVRRIAGTFLHLRALSAQDARTFTLEV